MMIKSIPTSVKVQEKIISDIKSIIFEAEEMLGATADQAGEKIVNLRERIKYRLADAKVRLVDAEDALLTKTRAAAQATDDFVHESPWMAIGVGAGVGLFVGLLLARR